MKSSAEGEIIQVQGGHIIRATGRKDRHSKVFTAKGPRDRRVRLSAHTAIQFYDVQDRLGYDRPSKAVDWLIKKAKSAIDKLADAPPFNPNASIMEAEVSHQEHEPDSTEYNFRINRQMGGSDEEDNNNNNNTTHQRDFSSAFFAPSMNLDADTMKSFLPASTTNSTINFQNYPHDIISRTTNPNEDLGLSLHPYSASADQTLFTGSTPVAFDANFQRFAGWNGEITAENRGLFMANSQPSVTLLSQQAMFVGQGPAPALVLSQRGTLQSSFAQTFRPWGDLSTEHQDKTAQVIDHQGSSLFGARFGSHGMMQGFSVPARIHGGEGEGFGADKPSSSSTSPPNSNH